MVIFLSFTTAWNQKKWFPNTIICVECFCKEEEEIEREEEIEELKEVLENAKWEDIWNDFSFVGTQNERFGKRFKSCKNFSKKNEVTQIMKNL